MDIERLKNNREFEFHDRIWDDQTQIVMFYKEQPEFRITFWDSYFMYIFGEAKPPVFPATESLLGASEFCQSGIYAGTPGL